MAKGAIDHKKHGIHDLELCKVCYTGDCCRWGTNLDLFEVARILEKKKTLKLPKPWFDYVRRDKTFPSGFMFTTLVRDRKCVFQDGKMRCLIYDVRPRYCSEFPLESGKRAPDYGTLCHYPVNQRKKRKTGKK